MSSEKFVSESTISGNQANIPAAIRRALGVDDGDLVRWIYDGGDVRVEVVREREGTFSDFEGYAGESTDAANDRDSWGIEYCYSFDDDFDGFDGVTRLDTSHNPYDPDE